MPVSSSGRSFAHLRQFSAQRLRNAASGAQGVNRLISAGDAKTCRAGYRAGPTMPGAHRRQHLRRRVDLRFQDRGLVTEGDKGGQKPPSVPFRPFCHLSPWLETDFAGVLGLINGLRGPPAEVASA
jgi:hypothetical protein